MPDSRHLEILTDLLKTAERSFEASVKHAATVDDKAQKTSGLAGVFLAVAFAFTQPKSLEGLRHDYGDVSLWLLYTGLVLFVVSVVLCLRAMWLRSVPVGGLSVTSHEMVSRLIFELTTEEIDDGLMAAYKENQFKVWKAAIAERHLANIEKTRLVHYAQVVLTMGIVLAAINLSLLGFAASRNAVPSNQSKPMPEQKENPAKNPAAQADAVREDSSHVTMYFDQRVGPEKSDGGFIATQPKTRQQVLAKLSDPSFVASQIKSLDRLR